MFDHAWADAYERAGGDYYPKLQVSVPFTPATGPRLLGLFADEDMDFELDRNPAAQPTTAEMAAAALRALSQASPNGFVLRW